MALLTRPTQNKIFGSTALASELTIFGTHTVSTDASLILNSVEAQRGWGTVSANGFPPLEWFNSMGYGLSYQTAYLFQQGIPQWTVLQEFYTNSYVVGSDGKLYRSKTGVAGTPNSGNNPTTDVTNINWIESIKDDMPAVINGAPEKITPVDTDLIGLVDSNSAFSLKKLTFANLKSTLSVLFAPFSTIGSLGVQGASAVSFTLTQAMAGSLQVLTGGGLTITLPAINTIKSGSLFLISNPVATLSTIALNGNTTGLSRLTILPGETLTIQSDGGTNYRLINRSKDFSSNTSVNGYSYLPNGLLIQWGSYTGSIAAGGGVLNVTFPVTFPVNVFYSNVAVVSFGVNLQATVPTCVATTTSNLAITSTDVDSPITQLRWFSIGF